MNRNHRPHRPPFPSGPYAVRPATAEDVPAVARIWHTGWIDGHLGHVPPELAAQRSEAQFTPRARERLDRMWVGVSGGDVQGFIVVVDDELEQIYVAGAARGTGLAALLLRQAEAMIRDAGPPCAWLAVATGNQRARAFYARQGWRDAGPLAYQAETEAGPLAVPCHRYERDLTAPAPARPPAEAGAGSPLAPCALGLSVHTGWAAGVVVAGSVLAPRVLLRERIEFLGDPDRFVYHRAAEMPLDQAERTVATATSDATRQATAALHRLIAAARAAEAELVVCAIVANQKPVPGTLEAILAAHPKMHSAEGALCRDALEVAARACGLGVRRVSPQEAETSQPRAVTEDVGKQVGRPWGKDQRLAALAAWSALGR